MLPASWAGLSSQCENSRWYVPADESGSNSSPSDTAGVGFLTFLFLLILPTAAQAAQVDGQAQQIHTEPSCCYTAQEDERLKQRKTWDMSFFVKRDIWGKLILLFKWKYAIYNTKLPYQSTYGNKILWVVQKASLLWYLNYEYSNKWPTIFK